MKQFNFQLFTRSAVRSLTPYQAKEIPCRVKLDANESPYAFLDSQDVLLRKSLAALNRYPDPEGRDLKRAIGGAFRVNPDCVLLGNGSDEIISYLVMTFGGPVLFPTPTFSMYGIIAQAVGEQSVCVPLDSSFDLDLRAMLTAMKRLSPKLVFLSTPNNPTGNCFSRDRIMAVIAAAKGIVVIDEAYQPFAKEETFVPLIREQRNVAVLRTVSKVGFAALRVGFLIADRALIREVNKVRLPYNVNVLSQAIAQQAFRHKGSLQRAMRSIVSERANLTEQLASIEGVQPFPSEANFILFKVVGADRVHEGLVKQGVLVRNMGGVIKDTLRVTVGTPAENRRFIAALRVAVAKSSGLRRGRGGRGGL